MIKAYGEITGTQLVHEGRAALHGLNINTDGENDLAVVVRDSTGADGKALWRQVLKGGDGTGGVVFASQGLAVERGIFVEMITQGAGSVNVYYRL